MQANLANTYAALGKFDEATQIEQDVYSGRLKLDGEEHRKTLMAANNYTASLLKAQRFAEAKPLLLESIPVARRVVGDSHELTLRLRWMYARALQENPDATLDDLREAVTTGEDIEPTARRVFGGAHPLTKAIARDLRDARTVLRVRSDCGRVMFV